MADQKQIQKRGFEEAIDVPEVLSTTAVAAQLKGELESQVDIAHKYPRSIKRFLNDAIDMATLSQEVAESCMYALPRGGKVIEGPSIRLAEIVLSAWGNLYVASRPFDVGDTHVTAQAVAFDVQKNSRLAVEARRRITNKNGERFNDDMINVTMAAAQSIARRNAIFGVVPRAYTDQVYQAAVKVAIGDAQTLIARRDKALAALIKMGATQERVLAAIKKPSVEDVGVGDLSVLFGYFNAIKDGQSTVDELFPEPAKPAPDLPETGAGGRMTLNVTPGAQSSPEGAGGAPSAGPPAAPVPPSEAAAAGGAEAAGSAAPAAAAPSALTLESPAPADSKTKRGK